MSVFEHPSIGQERPRPSNELAELIDVAVSRRAVLTGGLATAAIAFLGGGRGSLLRAVPAGAEHPTASRLIGFTPIGPSVDDVVRVPDGYVAQVLYRWGDPIDPPHPRFEFDATNSAAQQARQAGMGHDGLEYFPFDDQDEKNERGLLVVNHEFAESFLLFPDGDANWTAAKTAKSQAAHGVSVVEIKRTNSGWKVMPSDYARSINAKTPIAIGGPAARHQLLRTGADPDGTRVLGTVNNCAMGVTPWKTYLTCEENFNAYFGTAAPSPTISPLMAEYGIGANGFGPDWWLTDSRFDIAAEPNESNRFGWVVEIDPFKPGSRPVKRTALGRLKHEGATVTEAADGRLVVYTGDDERGEHMYKFVSSRPWRELIKEGRSPLDLGTLYVARFDNGPTTGDNAGVGTWLPLVHGTGPLTTANGWADQGQVLINARGAATALGATRMDRPEWVARRREGGDIFLALTNNTNRGTSYPTDDANPRPNNRFGHIVRWTEAGGDAGALTFQWAIFVLAGDPADATHGATPGIDAFGSPDGLRFDKFGRLWIQTDGTQPIACNNQMLVADPASGDIRRFLVGPKGCEVTGITFTPDHKTAFVNIQHPGEGGSAADPRAVSNWPDFRADGRPRDATIAIRRVDGKVVGT